MADFTHFNDQGRAKMVDVCGGGKKPISQRVAVAAGRVLVNEHTFALIQSGGMKKGDVLTVAQIAGVMGAKRTPDIIPMCHPILMDGINLVKILTEKGFDVTYTAIVPDEAEMIQSELLKCADEKKIALVLTTGGTGFSPRDITPEAAMEVIQRPTPGIPEAMRAESMKITPKGCLSRSVAGIRARTLIITLPGSQKASAENILAVIDPVAHGLDMLYSEGSADCAK